MKHLATKSKNFELFKYLIGFSQIDVDAIDNCRNTILHLACEYNNLDLVKFIIKLDQIVVSTKNDFEENALQISH